jgi:folate-binding protein YgfZ
MNQHWETFLQQQHAMIRDGVVQHFGDPQSELQAAGADGVVCDLSHLDVIRFSGEDARAFLNGQFTNDVMHLAENRAQLNGYCSPKGRLLAAFTLWGTGSEYFMQLPASLAEPIRKRLAMFILRSRVKAEITGDTVVRIGVAGAAAPHIIERACNVALDEPFAIARRDNALVMCLPGSSPRYEIIATPDAATGLWQRLTGQAAAAGSPCWEWLDIRSGVPAVLPQTQDEFVPQMMNFDIVGGVSFSKGCYPGQEIVARTHYLGRLKRRMCIAHIASSQAPQAGEPVFDPSDPAQACGMIAHSAAAPDGGHDVLAVAQITAIEAAALRWNAPDGPALELLPLPYELPAAVAAPAQ